jgi:membrane-bound metal-dependent hydrolase YbcI (DUF457 family)
MAAGATVNAVCQWSECRANPNAEFSFGSLALCSLAGGAAASLPDLLEPAFSPNHRGFFHSLTAAALVAYGISGRHTQRLGVLGKMVLWVLGLGYLSHLAADATTPKSLPIFGWGKRWNPSLWC